MKTFPAPLNPYKKEVTPLPDIPEPKTILLECIYGSHKADLLHRGTAYCRSCYDGKNLTGTLIN